MSNHSIVITPPSQKNTLAARRANEHCLHFLPQFLQAYSLSITRASAQHGLFATGFRLWSIQLDRPSSAGCCRSCIQGTCAPRCGTARSMSFHNRCRGSISDKEKGETRHHHSWLIWQKNPKETESLLWILKKEVTLPSSSDRLQASGRLQPERRVTLGWCYITLVQDKDLDGERRKLYLLIKLLPHGRHVTRRPQANWAREPEEISRLASY